MHALRLAQQGGNSNGSVSGSPETGLGFRSPVSGNPQDSGPETMIEAMRRENEQLRSKLVETERDYIRISRLNEIYREELIEHRTKVRVYDAEYLYLMPLYSSGYPLIT